MLKTEYEGLRFEERAPIEAGTKRWQIVMQNAGGFKVGWVQYVRGEYQSHTRCYLPIKYTRDLLAFMEQLSETNESAVEAQP